MNSIQLISMRLENKICKVLELLKPAIYIYIPSDSPFGTLFACMLS